MTAPTEVVLYPDIEMLLVTYLRDVVGDEPYFCTFVPPGAEFHDRLPVVRIWRVGGIRRLRKQLDEAVVDVDVWHTDLKSLNDLTEQIRAAIEAMQTYKTASAAITETREVAGPRRLPEQDQLVIRAGFTVSLLVRPLPA